MKMPAGPDGSPTSLIADGKPSIKVLRLPNESTIEIRPECEAVVPVSETSKLPWFVKAEPSGSRNPTITFEHWANPDSESKNRLKQSEMNRASNLMLSWIMGVSFLALVFVEKI
jgi:hypothetical protein